jgi:hypothetical protein
MGKYDDLEVALISSRRRDLPMARSLRGPGRPHRCGRRSGEERKSAVILAIDERQYASEEQLAALISALHRANQKQLPMTSAAA